MTERRKLALAIVVAFVFGLAGGVLGSLGTVAALRYAGRPFFAAEGRPGERSPGGLGPRRRGERGRPLMERMLLRQLDLSEAQRVRIEAILDDARPRYAAVRESTRAEIDRVLTPEQRTRLQELEDRFTARRRNRAEP